MKKVFKIVVIILFSIMTTFIVAGAEGSKDLVENGGYRPYTEWYNKMYAGMYRHQVIKAYAYAGEKIQFASSVYNAYDSKDIVMTKPDGTKITFDVIQKGKGHITSVSNEKNQSYTPLTYTAEKDGIYEFEFHSTKHDNGNPSKALTTATWDINQTGVVAAWDVSVVKNGSIVEGRVFADFLSLNMGSNMNAGNTLNSKVYVLTDDGFIYSVDFNGMDPFGFLFFANNKGLYSKSTGSSIYKSIKLDPNDVQMENMGDVEFHRPNEEDTEYDRTYSIFFNMPSDDLPESIKSTPTNVGTVENFYFEGYAKGKGYVGEGGYFNFDVQGASSFQIKIDLTNYTYTDDNGNEMNGGIVYLANHCINGKNSIYWDGKDEHGNIVKAGVYGANSDSRIKVTIEIKNGEFHFPLLDVENNYDGIIVKLENTPVDVNGNEMEISESHRYTVYYNNQDITGNASDDYREGMDSSQGASAYNSKLGDNTLLDLWTYCPTVQDSELETEIEQFEISDKIGSIELVKTDEQGQSLKNAVFELYQKGDDAAIGEYTTDESGKIVVEHLPYGTYYFKEIKAPDGYEINGNGLSEDIELTIDNYRKSINVINKETINLFKTISITKRIYKDDLWNEHGTPTFIFKIYGTDNNGVEYSFHKSIVFNENSGYREVTVDGKIYLELDFDITVKIGTYYVEEYQVSRFNLEKIDNVKSGSVDKEKVKFVFDISSEDGKARFTNKKEKWQDYSHNDIVVNEIN